jgi:hypothetical protein
MIEQMQPSLILIALFVLLFMLTFYLFERYKLSIQAFWAKQSWLWKIPWKPINKIFCLWAGIILVRKLIYYVPCFGIIQTTSSIRWIDTCVLTAMCFIFFLFLVAATVIGIFFGFKTNRSKRKELVVVQLRQFLVVLFILGVFFTLLIARELKLDAVPLAQIMVTPLIMLKMMCSGKFLGLLTSAAVGYLIFNRCKKIKQGITRDNIKFLALPLLIIIVFLVFAFNHFIGNGRSMMIDKLETANSRKDFEDLLEAAHSIKDDHYKSGVLRAAAMAIADRDDISWATAIAKDIPDIKIRASALKLIQPGMEEK